MRKALLVFLLFLAACSQAPKPPVEQSPRCISYTDSEMYPDFRMTCYCFEGDDGWVECPPPEVLE